MQFLLQHFVGTHDPGDPSVREKAGAFAEWYHTAFNALLFLIKFLTSFFVHSIALRADAFRNLANVFAALFRIFSPPSSRDSSKKRRGRYAVAFLASFFIIETGFSFFTRAFSGLARADDLTGSFPAVFVLIGVMLLRLYEASTEMYLGHKTEVRALISAAGRAKTDNILTGLALCVILLERVFHFHLDHFAAIIIAVSVMVSGFKMALVIVQPSISEEPDPELVRTVRDKVRAYSSILGTGRTEVKFFGEGRRLIAMRVLVPAEGDRAELFSALRQIEKTVEKETGVTLALHMDTVPASEKDLLFVRTRLEEETEKADPLASVGNLHTVRGSSFTNLIFDLYVPASYDTDRRRSLSELITAQMRAIDPRYSCIIEVREIR